MSQPSKNKNSELVRKGNVILPRFVLYLGLGIMTAAGAAIGFAVVHAASIGALIVLLLFFLLGAGLVNGFRNCRIAYDETGFTAKNFLGITRRYLYKEITGIRGLERDVTLYLDRRSVRIDALASGKREFLSYARYVYRSQHDGKAIPLQVGHGSTRQDLFHGHVSSPGEFVLIYTLLLILCFGMMVFLFIASFVLSPVDLSDCIETADTFQSAEEKRGTLWLESGSEDIRYALKGYRRYVENQDYLLSHLGDGTTFLLYYSDITDHGDHYRAIEALEGADDTILLSTEAAKARNRDNFLAGAALFGGLFLLIAGIFWTSIRISRHPERYSNRFIRLFFKEGYFHR